MTTNHGVRGSNPFSPTIIIGRMRSHLSLRDDSIEKDRSLALEAIISKISSFRGLLAAVSPSNPPSSLLVVR